MYVNKFELNLHQKAEGPIQQSCIERSKVSRLNKFLLVLSPRNYVSTIGHVAYKQTLEDRVGSSFDLSQNSALKYLIWFRSCRCHGGKSG